MASKLFQRSTAPARAFIRIKSSPPSVAARPSSSGGAIPHTIPAPPSRPPKPFFRTRLPVELASGESLLPLHTATASSLLRSMLSSKVGQWCSLSEDCECSQEIPHNTCSLMGYQRSKV